MTIGLPFRVTRTALLTTVLLSLLVSMTVIAVMGPTLWALLVIAALCAATGYVVGRVLYTRYHATAPEENR